MDRSGQRGDADMVGSGPGPAGAAARRAARGAVATVGLLLLTGCGAVDRALSDGGDTALAAEASARAEEVAGERLPYGERAVTVAVTWDGDRARASSTSFSSGACGYQPDGTWRATTDGSLQADPDDAGVWWEELDVVTDGPVDASWSDGAGTDVAGADAEQTVTGPAAPALLRITGSVQPGGDAGLVPGRLEGPGSVQLLDRQGSSARFTAAPAVRPAAPGEEPEALAGLTVEIVCSGPAVGR